MLCIQQFSAIQLITKQAAAHAAAAAQAAGQTTADQGQKTDNKRIH